VKWSRISPPRVWTSNFLLSSLLALYLLSPSPGGFIALVWAKRKRSVATTAQQIGNSGQASSGWNSVSSSPPSVNPQTDKRTKARKHTPLHAMQAPLKRPTGTVRAPVRYLHATLHSLTWLPSHSTQRSSHPYKPPHTLRKKKRRELFPCGPFCSSGPYQTPPSPPLP